VELSPRLARHQGVGGARASGGLAAEEPSTELAHGLRAATFWLRVLALGSTPAGEGSSTGAGATEGRMGA
jgi:hypothetical protein